MVEPVVPMPTRIRLIHAVLQQLANIAGVDVLHIKGPAVATELLDRQEQVNAHGDLEVTVVPRASSDADLLVRPEHVGRFLSTVRSYGWVLKTDFTSGSAFGHALNIYHPKLGNADIHRHFPGLPIDRGFEALWQGRNAISLGNISCSVPSLTGQRLILLLHAARSGANHPDARRAWHNATSAEQDLVLRFAQELDAEIAVAAALGKLDAFSEHPDYLLWRYFSSGENSRFAEWKARWASAKNLPERYRVVKNLIFFSPAVLESELGHAPSRRELAARHLRRWSTMIHELLNTTKRSRSHE